MLQPWHIPASILVSAAALVFLPRPILAHSVVLLAGSGAAYRQGRWWLAPTIWAGGVILIQHDDKVRALGGGILNLIYVAGILLLVLLAIHVFLVPAVGRFFGANHGTGRRR